MLGKYTVNEVEERTKVPASTLRQWERRYGFPMPDRSEAGYRLYSDKDLDQISEMKRHIGDGIPASRAAELAKTIGTSVRESGSCEQFVQILVKAFKSYDEDRADNVLSEAHALHSVETVIQDVMVPAVVHLGDAWHRGEIPVTTEHFASHYVQGRLRTLLSSSPKSTYNKVLIGCAPDDLHELGALTVAVLLRRRGHQVIYLGAATPLQALAETARDENPVAVVIAATIEASAERLLSGRTYLKNIAPVLAFGGAVFSSRPELARSLGGTLLNGTPVESTVQLSELVHAVRQ